MASRDQCRLTGSSNALEAIMRNALYKCMFTLQHRPLHNTTQETKQLLTGFACRQLVLYRLRAVQRAEIIIHRLLSSTGLVIK